MPAMPPGAPAQEAEQQAAPQADAVKLAQDVGQGLAQLAELLNGSQSSSEDEKAQMSQILSSFVDLVEKKLGGGAEPEMEPADQGVVPMEAGMNGKPMGPQSRM